MEKVTSRDDDRLLLYLDALLDEVESKKLEAQLRTNAILRSRLEELKSVHSILRRSAVLENPSLNFTQRVMKSLDSVPVSSSFSPRNGVLLLCGVLVAVGVGLIMLQAGAFDSVNGTIRPDVLPVNKQWTNQIPSIPFNGKIVMNAILVIATGISFWVLDRTVLRPLFNKRAGLYF